MALRSRWLAAPLLLSFVLGCGHGAGRVPPRVTSIHPFTACSQADTSFVLRGEGFERVGSAVHVEFRAVRGTPFRGGLSARVLAEAYVDSPTRIRGVLPATRTDGVVETTVSVLWPEGTASRASPVRLCLMPRDSEAYREQRDVPTARLGDMTAWDESAQSVMDAGVDEEDGTLWVRVWHPNGQLAVEGRQAPDGGVETWTSWDARGRRLATETSLP